MSDVTREELRELRLDLSDQMRLGFTGLRAEVAGVNSRLDVLNGRTRTNEIAVSEQGAKVRNLEREVFKTDGEKKSEDFSQTHLTIAHARWLIGIIVAASGLTATIVVWFFNSVERVP